MIDDITETGREQPNVLVILTDEWRAQNVGYVGDRYARTPNIDRLASESIDFTEAVSGQPICCPARASFLTGQYPLEHGVYINDVELRPTGPTLAEVFRDNGYRTGYIGKWHLYGSPDGRFERRDAFIPVPSRHGFGYWKAQECTHDYNHSPYYAGDDRIMRYWDGYDAIGQTDDALDFIADGEASEPFFLMLSYGPPHFPLQTAPERFRELYENAEVQLPPNVPDWAAASAGRDLRGYYAHIAALDECVGRLLDRVDSTNTIVVFTSDHGDMLWSQGLEHKLTGWEEAVRVPLLIRAPRREATRSTQLFNSPDLMPTLLGFAGLPIPDTVSGIDLSHPDAGPTTAFLSAPVAYSSMRRAGLAEYRGVRDGQYTYIRSIDGPWLLYDNVEDPFQLRNLCGDPDLAPVQERLERELTSWLTRLDDEFLRGDRYLRRDGLLHYFEVNEPIGFSGTDQWESTIHRGRGFSIDTTLKAISEDPAARAIVDAVRSDLLGSDAPLHDRRSLRLLAMTDVGLLTNDQLVDLDRKLLALGPRRCDPMDSVALAAWPPQGRLAVRAISF
jgi:arylsulfatase A-like enzyme